MATKLHILNRITWADFDIRIRTPIFVSEDIGVLEEKWLVIK